MHDLVEREWRRGPIGVLAVVFGQLGGDAVEPLVQHALGPRIEGRERADDAGLALGNDQLRVGHDEHRRGDHRNAQARLELLQVHVGWVEREDGVWAGPSAALEIGGAPLQEASVHLGRSLSRSNPTLVV